MATPKKILNKKSIFNDLSAYSYYKEHAKFRLTINQFLEIMERYTYKCVDSIMKGKAGELFGGMGVIFLEKIKRHITNKAVNWSKCDRDENGKIIKIAYFEDDFYIRFVWKRPLFFHKKRIGYDFFPCRGQSNSPHNLKKRLVRELKTNPYFHTILWVAKRLESIEQIDKMSGRVVAYYSSYKELAKDFPSPRNIQRALNNPSLSAYGFLWRVKWKLNY